MGNTASNPNNPNRTTNIQRTDQSSSTANRDSSASPSPGNPHRSLRSKKKSLELPDLASLSLSPSSSNTRGRQKAAAIPIPTAPNNKGPFSHYHEAQGIQPQRQRPRNFPSTTNVLQDDFDEVLALEGHRIVPYTPPSIVVQQQSHRDQHQQRPHPAPPPRGRQPPLSARQQAHLSRIQELYDQSLDPHHPAAPPSSPASFPRPVFAREIVRSSIPTVLGEAAQQAAATQDSSVLSPIQEDLAADPVPVNIVWKGGGTEVVLSRAGDDDWKGRQPMERESPDSNKWTVTVYLRPGTHHVRFLVDGQWRVADDLPAAVDDQGSLANYVAVYAVAPPPPLAPSPPPPPRKMVPGQSFWSAASTDGDNDTDEPQPQAAVTVAAKHPQNAAVMAYVQAKWTNVLPLELIEAQKEEEMYLAASAGQFEAQQQQQAATGRVVVTGFVPAPNIPPAPGLPRHLDKLILNSKVGEKTGGQDRAGTPGSQGSGVGSGQASGWRRDRKDRERERERDRDRDRERERERDRDREDRRDRDRDRGGRSRRPNIPPPPPPSEDGSAEMDIESTYLPMNRAGRATSPSAGASTKHQVDSSSSSGATGTLTGVTTPHVSVPATPTLSPTQSQRKLTFSETTSPLTERMMPISGSRAITIDTANLPAVTDDASVLSVPSHVVLHHLCTSAIKNGVLAVSNTTRYKKKYLTTVYYKPT